MLLRSRSDAADSGTPFVVGLSRVPVVPQRAHPRDLLLGVSEITEERERGGVPETEAVRSRREEYGDGPVFMGAVRFSQLRELLVPKHRPLPEGLAVGAR